MVAFTFMSDGKDFGRCGVVRTGGSGHRSGDSTGIDAQRMVGSYVTAGNRAGGPRSRRTAPHVPFRLTAGPARRPLLRAMRDMTTRGHGHPWQLVPILGIGLLATVLAGSATGALSTPVVATHAGPTAVHEAAHQIGAAAAPAHASAADLAIQFEALLGQHSVLAADVMRSRIRGDDDFVQAANAALGKNTDAMSALVGQLFGAATAKKFAPMWSQHIVALVAYAGALSDQDKDALADARKELTEYEEDLGAFFAGASKGRLNKSAADSAVAMHIGHLTTQADAYAKKDYVTADRIYREGYEHTYDLGGTLADALLPAADRATLQQPIWRLRSQLGKLLAEHAVLVEDVTRAAVTNTPDFSAAAQMINANTSNLAAAMDTLFGAPAAKSFQSLWAFHVEQLVAYSAATAAKDPAKQDAARNQLHTFESRMSAFLGTATSGRMTPANLGAALLLHDQMLLKHADAYGAKDYKGAHDIAYDTYNHMFEVARQLADAFGATVAARLPKGGPQTGYGGLAGFVERH
jgi:hypothetical protein